MSGPALSTGSADADSMTAESLTTSSLTAQDVRKIAVLARLELTDAEVAEMTPQLESILGFVEQLSELDTEDVAPMTTALDVVNQTRPDKVTPSLDRDQALAMSPKTNGECFQVPAVLKTSG